MGSLRLAGNATVYSAIPMRGLHVVHEIMAGHRVWLQVIEGELSVGDVAIATPGDGEAVTSERAVPITAREGAELLLIEFEDDDSGVSFCSILRDVSRSSGHSWGVVCVESATCDDAADRFRNAGNHPARWIEDPSPVPKARFHDTNRSRFSDVVSYSLFGPVQSRPAFMASPCPYWGARDGLLSLYEKAGFKVPPQLWPCLRHTFGTELASARVPVTTIKELMGHRSIQTTLRYIHVGDEAKAGALLQAFGETESEMAPSWPRSRDNKEK